MSLTHSLNLPDAELPSVLSALQAERERRLTEDRLRTTVLTRNRRSFMPPAPRIVSACSWPATRSARRWLVVSKPPCTPPVAIPTGGKANALIRPTVGWSCGVSGEVVRDTVRRVLVGRSGSLGTGAIPKDAIGELVTARGIADLLDTIKVQHVSGG